MDTFFAPPERLEGDALRRDIDYASKNPVIDELLHSVSGVLAVLNEERQILAVNDALVQTLGIANASEVLGLRPGEAIHCVHSREMPGGCGTSAYCPTCGAVISMIASLKSGLPEERACVVAVEKDGKIQDLFFRARCSPVTFQGTRFLLLFMQDITQWQKLVILEKTFFHDINNIVMGLASNCELLAEEEAALSDEAKSRVDVIARLARRLSCEVAMQRAIVKSRAREYTPVLERVPVSRVVREIKDAFGASPLCARRSLEFAGGVPDATIETDATLAARVIGNMITNALEATDDGDAARFWVERSGNDVIFSVWNRKPIPGDVAKRVFQRNFSTKADMGRGLGTYSMKLFGEEVLGGHVDFATSSDGTTFRFSLAAA